MERFKRLALCFLLPVLFVGLAYAFARVRGPFFHGDNYDPDYAYLFNGLNLLLGYPPWAHRSSGHADADGHCRIIAVVSSWVAAAAHHARGIG